MGLKVDESGFGEKHEKRGGNKGKKGGKQGGKGGTKEETRGEKGVESKWVWERKVG